MTCKKDPSVVYQCNLMHSKSFQKFLALFPAVKIKTTEWFSETFYQVKANSDSELKGQMWPDPYKVWQLVVM